MNESVVSPPSHHNAATEEFDVAVVLLNFNGGALVARVAEAVQVSRGVNAVLVVVDNGSSDGSDLLLEEAVGRDTSRSLLLRSGANGGFAAGNNLGLWSMPSRAVCLLNNDAVVEPTTLAELVAHLDSRPDVGACGPRLVTADGQTQPFSHGDDPSPAYLWRRALAHRGGRTLHEWAGDRPRHVDWVAGTCLMIRTSALNRVGLLDEGIFMYFEDNDYCRRLRNRGYTVDFVPSAVVRHHNQPSQVNRSRREQYYRGLARFYDRHYGLVAGRLIRVSTGLRLKVKK